MIQSPSGIGTTTNRLPGFADQYGLGGDARLHDLMPTAFFGTPPHNREQHPTHFVSFQILLVAQAVNGIQRRGFAVRKQSPRTHDPGRHGFIPLYW